MFKRKLSKVDIQNQTEFIEAHNIDFTINKKIKYNLKEMFKSTSLSRLDKMIKQLYSKIKTNNYDKKLTLHLYYALTELYLNKLNKRQSFKAKLKNITTTIVTAISVLSNVVNEITTLLINFPTTTLIGGAIVGIIWYELIVSD